MKRSIWFYGLLSGLVVSALMIGPIAACYKSGEFEGSMVLGYAGMLIAFIFVFFGIRHFRDRHYGGHISFGKAFMTGLKIMLVTCTVYVVTWLIVYYFFIPDFMDKYVAYELRTAAGKGLTATELAAKAKEMDSYKEMYKNPVWVILWTYLEILPVGLVATLLSALLLKRKEKAMPL